MRIIMFLTTIIIGAGFIACTPSQFSVVNPTAVSARSASGSVNVVPDPNGDTSGQISQPASPGDGSGSTTQPGQVGGSLLSVPSCGCLASESRSASALGLQAILATNGAGNVGTNNGTGNTGNGNGNGNVGNGNGNNNSGNGNGNDNCGNDNGNHNGGSDNGNNNSSDGNGNGFSSDGNGNGVASAASQCCECALTGGVTSVMSLQSCLQASGGVAPTCHSR